MARKDDQEKPLAPASCRIHVEEEKAMPMELQQWHSHRRCIKCCGCVTAFLLIQVVIMLVLAFTIFHIKDPVLKMNSVKIEGIDLLNRSNSRPTGLNLTVESNVSVKNPNVASFRFSNTTTSLDYNGTIIGEARTPAGMAKARRTTQVHVSVDVMLDKILAIPRLKDDLVSGALPMNSYTRISGTVKIIGIVRKRFLVKMNCTMIINVTSQGIQDLNCRRQVSL